MRILIVSQYFWPESFRINDLAFDLVKRGHEIVVLTGKPNYPQGKFYRGYNWWRIQVEYEKKIKIIRVPILPRGNGNGFNLFLNYFSFMVTGSLYSFFWCRKFDAVLALNYSPITAVYPAIINKLKYRSKLILWVQDLWPESVKAASNVETAIVYRILLKMVKMIYGASTKILISSQGFKKSIVEKGVSESKIIYMPNWSEDLFEESSSIDTRKYSSIIPNGFIVMFAGNVGEAQDFESIIKAAELTRDNNQIKWVVIGDGRKWDDVFKEIQKRGLEKSFYLLGRYALTEMPSFFVHADIMLFSLKSDEIFSLTLPSKVQSYMAFGKPIAAMINGEGSEVIAESKSGFTCCAGDYQGLADNIFRAYEMPADELANLGKNGKEFYQNNFAKNMLIDRFEYILENNEENINHRV